MTLLAIETSTEKGSVALLRDSALLFEEHFAADRGCGAVLFSVLQRSLKTQPDTIVVGLGPGSYSGVRIAIAAAIGLCFGTKARLIGIPSVVALAEPGSHYLTAGDARRSSFHFAEVRDGLCLQEPQLLDAAELSAKAAASDLPVYGSAPLAQLPQLQMRFPEARYLAQLAELGRSIVAVDQLEPIYMRAPHITQPRGD